MSPLTLSGRTGRGKHNVMECGEGQALRDLSVVRVGGLFVIHYWECIFLSVHRAPLDIDIHQQTLQNAGI